VSTRGGCNGSSGTSCTLSSAQQADSIRSDGLQAVSTQRALHKMHQNADDNSNKGPALWSSSSNLPDRPDDTAGDKTTRPLAELGHQWHGQQVVAAAFAQGGEEALHQLVRRFRQGFVLTCRPRYLPQAWDVDAVDSRQFGDYSVYAQNGTASAVTAGRPAVVEAADSVIIGASHHKQVHAPGHT
jgi:hypothetical protein